MKVSDIEALARLQYATRMDIHGHYEDDKPFDALPQMQRDWIMAEAKAILGAGYVPPSTDTK